MEQQQQQQQQQQQPGQPNHLSQMQGQLFTEDVSDFAAPHAFLADIQDDPQPAAHDVRAQSQHAVQQQQQLSGSCSVDGLQRIPSTMVFTPAQDPPLCLASSNSLNGSALLGHSTSGPLPASGLLDALFNQPSINSNSTDSLRPPLVISRARSIGRQGLGAGPLQQPAPAAAAAAAGAYLDVSWGAVRALVAQESAQAHTPPGSNLSVVAAVHSVTSACIGLPVEDAAAAAAQAAGAAAGAQPGAAADAAALVAYGAALAADSAAPLDWVAAGPTVLPVDSEGLEEGPEGYLALVTAAGWSCRVFMGMWPTWVQAAQAANAAVLAEHLETGTACSSSLLQVHPGQRQLSARVGALFGAPLLL